MHLTHLRAFLVALETGSVSQAAVRLHVGQSTLTRQIAALEVEIGTPLFERTARGVVPTAAGQALADSLARPLADIETAIIACRRFGGGERSTLRIGYLQSLARSYLNPALAALRVAHPGTKVKLVEQCAAGQIRGLRSGELDVGLIGHEGRLVAREFYTRTIRSLDVVAALPAGHPLESRASLRLADLRRELFVGKNEIESPGHNEWLIQMCRRAGFRPRFVQHADTISEMLSFVASDGAVALLPEFVAEVDAPSIITRPIQDTAAKWNLLVVWQRGRVAASVNTLLKALGAASTSAAIRSAPATALQLA